MDNILGVELDEVGVQSGRWVLAVAGRSAEWAAGGRALGRLGVRQGEGQLQGEVAVHKEANTCKGIG